VVDGLVAFVVRLQSIGLQDALDPRDEFKRFVNGMAWKEKQEL